MSEVKRYDISAFGGMSMDESSDGAYVNYEDYAAIEDKCAALAAENAWLKSGAIKSIEDIQCFYDSEAWHVSEDGESETAVVALDDAKGSVEHFVLNVKTPATDAFLAEVRAQGVEMFAQWCRGERDFTLIDEDVADAAAYEECVKRAEYFSAQLRKGGNQ